MKKKIFMWAPYNDGEMGNQIDSLYKKKFYTCKFLFLIRNIVKDKDIKLIFYLYGANNSKLKYLMQIIKLYLWAMLNKINIFKFDFTNKVNIINSNDIFYGQSRVILQKNIYKIFLNHKFNLILHLSHYEVNTKKKSENAKKIKVKKFVSENNLTKNSDYFKKFFYYHGDDNIVLPIVAGKRFKNYKEFNKRDNRCLVTGRLFFWEYNNENYKEFTDFYKINYQHQLRYDVFMNIQKYENLFTSHLRAQDYNSILSIDENGNLKKEVEKANYKSEHKVKMDYYYKFNMLEEYNNHKFFLAAEEMNDLPSIHTTEGMNCGSALIAESNDMYKGWGMKEGVHYIGHSGEFEDVLDKIKYYQKNSEALEKIATNGFNFAVQNLNEKVVTKKFMDQLKII